MTAAASTPAALPGEHNESGFHTLSALLNTRYSCRAFLPDALPRATIDQILATAQRTASWCNAQPWQLTISSGASLARLRDALQAHIAAAVTSATTATAPRLPPTPDLPWPREYRGVYQERRRECGWGLYEALGIAKSDREASARQAAQNFAMFGAPHVAIVTSDEALGVYGAVDCGAYVANFMLAAHSLGVGSIAQAALAFGGLGTVPWRDPAVEAMLVGESPSDALFAQAADVLLADARGHGDNDFKVPLARRVLIATLRELTA